MESDIVERLRGAASKDYGCQCPKCEAADEIERLRAELAAAIKQRDEARELNKSWEQKAATWLATPEAIARLQSYRDLGQQVAEAHSKIDLLRAELDAMRKQRDEARRMICEDESYNHKSGVTPREVAEDRGWDCFAKKEGGGA